MRDMLLPRTIAFSAVQRCCSSLARAHVGCASSTSAKHRKTERGMPGIIGVDKGELRIHFSTERPALFRILATGRYANCAVPSCN